MKKLLLLLAIVATTGLSLFAKAPKAPKNPWRLVWQENFSGNAIDTAVWTKIGRGTADWDNYMSSDPALYDVSGGVLTLRAVQNTTSPADTAAYLTGGIYSKDKQLFENGRIEIRAKLGSARGFWPAFWLLSNDSKWPGGGEIDIMEHLNHDTIIYQTCHSAYTLADNNTPPKGGVAPHKIDEWNTYAAELYADSIVLYVNDIKSVTYPRVKPAVKDQFPFADGPFYLLLDAQLGGGWVGAVDPAELPVQMQIDGVKFYKKK